MDALEESGGVEGEMTTAHTMIAAAQLAMDEVLFL
jgi:hypothetical protein